MLRASSLGLCLPPSAIRGHRPCFLIRKTEIILSARMVSEARAAQPFLPFVHSLKGDGAELNPDSEAKETFSQEDVVTQDGPTHHTEEHPRATQLLQQSSSSQSPHVAFRLPPPERHINLTWRKNRTGSRQSGVKLRKTFNIHDASVSQTKPANHGESPQFPEPVKRVSLPDPENSERKSHIKQYIIESPYPMGLPWRPVPVKNIWMKQDASSLETPPSDREVSRQSLLQTLGTTTSAADAWEAYSELLANSPENAGEPIVPFQLMHRVCRLLARHRPKTRTEFMRLHSLLVAIREAGGEIHLHEWNALIDGAGKGTRKTGTVDYENSLSFYKDMTLGYMPGTTLSQRQDREDGEQATSWYPPVQPDIYTYTILLNIAARTSDSRCFRHATGLLQASGLPPNRITHLALLKYFTATKQMSGVRSTLLKMEQQSLEVGLDGINAFLLSYGYNDRLDIVMMVYRLLRHNVSQEFHDGEDNVVSVARQLKREEFIVVPLDMKPNEVTYTTMIQIMAYHGNLAATLTVFVDMISALNLEKGAPLIPDEKGVLKPTTYQPTIGVFRAIFLGFMRHGISLSKNNIVPPRLRATNPPGQPAWTLDNLEKMYAAFLDLPEGVEPSRSIIYWVIMAFKKTSNNDVDLLRRIWKQMETRFKGPWGGPNNRLRRIRATLFPDEK